MTKSEMTPEQRKAERAASAAAGRFQAFNQPDVLSQIIKMDGELNAGKTFPGFARVATASKPFTLDNRTGRFVVLKGFDRKHSVGMIVQEGPQIVFQETQCFPRENRGDAIVLFQQLSEAVSR